MTFLSKKQTAPSSSSLRAASYIIFLLKPHVRNFNKRLIKTPKLYSYDTGLLRHLLNIHGDHGEDHPFPYS